MIKKADSKKNPSAYKMFFISIVLTISSREVIENIYRSPNAGWAKDVISKSRKYLVFLVPTDTWSGIDFPWKITILSLLLKKAEWIDKLNIFHSR